jgi:hypothetical protein
LCRESSGKLQHGAGRGKTADNGISGLTHPPSWSLSGNHRGIAWFCWYHCSLEHDEGIVRIFGHTAGVKIEIPATGSQFTSGNSPRSMAVRQQPSPGTARASESLNESEWAEDGNHSALLNLDQRHLGAPVSRGRRREDYKPGPRKPKPSVATLLAALSRPARDAASRVSTNRSRE